MKVLQNETRAEDFSGVLKKAEGTLFISGVSMHNLATDSFDLLTEKASLLTEVKMLMLDPNWAIENIEQLVWLETKEDRDDFLTNLIVSYNKLMTYAEETLNVALHTYTGLNPLTMTGYTDGDEGELVVELIDYLPDSISPRFYVDRKEEELVFLSFYTKFNLHFSHAMLSK